jgi:integrase
MAKKHLTDAAIQRFRAPKAGSLEIFDLGFPGLALRVGHGGARSFVLFHRVGGKQKRTTLGRWPRVSLADARTAWRNVAEGRDPIPGRQSDALLFDKVIEEWLRRDQSENKPSSQYQVARIVESDLLPAWRGKPVADISKRDVIALLDSIVDRGAPIKARQTYSHINRFFRWCIERDILKANPMAGLKRPGNGKSRERVLSDAELAKVWRGADRMGPLGSVVRLLILTGARREEITQLRWSEIRDDHIHLEGTRTKTGAAHIIPLSAPAQQLLNNPPRIAGSDFVFTTNGIKAISGWARPKIDLDTASGVSDWRIHDLRRTVATGMQKLGVTLQTVEAVLGHTSGSRGGIVGVYQRHDFADEKRVALEAWGAHVGALVSEACNQ